VTGFGKHSDTPHSLIPDTVDYVPPHASPKSITLLFERQKAHYSRGIHLLVWGIWLHIQLLVQL